MTGVWVTKTPAPFVIQYGEGPIREFTEIA